MNAGVSDDDYSHYYRNNLNQMHLPGVDLSKQ